MIKGTIQDFRGSWRSGIAMLVIQDDSGRVHEIPCDNRATVRALDNMFGCIGLVGHTVNLKAIVGQRVVAAWDDMGITLGYLFLDDGFLE